MRDYSGRTMVADLMTFLITVCRIFHRGAERVWPLVGQLPRSLASR